MNTSTTQLAELITERLQLLGELRALAEHQLALIDSGEVSKLLPLLAVKQQRLERLQGVDAALNPYREEDPDSRAWPSEAARGACRAEADRCRELLAEVITLEREAEQRLCGRRDQVAAQLDSTIGGGAAAQSYGRRRTPHAGPLDLHSEA